MKRFKKRAISNIEAVKYTKETLGEVVTLFLLKLNSPPIFKITGSELALEVRAGIDRDSLVWRVAYGDYIVVDDHGEIAVWNSRAFEAAFVEDVEPSNPVPVEPETPTKKGA